MTKRTLRPDEIVSRPIARRSALALLAVPFVAGGVLAEPPPNPPPGPEPRPPRGCTDADAGPHADTPGHGRSCRDAGRPPQRK